MSDVQSAPASQQEVHYLGVAPYLYYADATVALEWLIRVLGFSEKVRYVDAGGEVFQALVAAGEAEFHLACVGADHWQAKGVSGPIGQLNVVYVDDVDLLHQQISTRLSESDHRLAALATLENAEEMPPAPQDQPYGARVFTISDPGGNSWTFWQQTSQEVNLPPGWREIRSADE